MVSKGEDIVNGSNPMTEDRHNGEEGLRAY